MTGSVAVDVVTGLIFIFMLYSLMASILQEALANLLALRAKMLLKSIARMLEDDRPWTNLRVLNFIWEQVKNFANCFIYSFNWRPFTKAFYEHRSLKYLSESSWNNKPSYLRSNTFAETLIDLLRGPLFDGRQKTSELIQNTLSNNTLNGLNGKALSIAPETLKHLKTLFADSGGDVDRFKFYLEDWFNEVQERATGWYKKQAQLMLFIIGFGLAYAFNVDSIAIAKILATNNELRKTFIEFSLNHYKDLYVNGQTIIIDTAAARKDTDHARTEIRKALEDANSILGLGRTDTCLADCQSIKDELRKVVIDNSMEEESKIKMVQKLCLEIERSKVIASHQKNAGLAFLGWILTALAISLGAQFWFDLLNKVAPIRSSLKNQESKASTTTGAQDNQTPVPPPNRVG